MTPDWRAVHARQSVLREVILEHQLTASLLQRLWQRGVFDVEINGLDDMDDDQLDPAERGLPGAVGEDEASRGGDLMGDDDTHVES